MGCPIGPILLYHYIIVATCKTHAMNNKSFIPKETQHNSHRSLQEKKIDKNKKIINLMRIHITRSLTPCPNLIEGPPLVVGILGNSSRDMLSQECKDISIIPTTSLSTSGGQKGFRES